MASARGEAMAPAEDEEVRVEVEAMQAVYGEDCRVIGEFPPHLAVHIAPRTADDSSQQFVEVTLGIKADAEYPKKPPYIYIVEMKGLDDSRETHLVTSINNKAQELSSSLMLVALCEEAVEILSNMNHPEGNCPLCLYPLLSEDRSSTSVPFMKLMSCYHCFHSECIIRWWKWLQEQNETNKKSQTMEAVVSGGSRSGMQTSINQRKGNCPVCRKVFNVKDIEHAIDCLGTNSSQLDFVGTITNEDENVILQSDLEKNRRQKYEAMLKKQEENRGLIEPKKDLVILPGMFLPEPAALPTTSIETSDEQCGDDSGCNPSNSLNNATTSKHKNSNTRRKKFHGTKRQPHAQPNRRQWIKKETDSSQ